MARYSGPVCRICRRAGEKLYLKGERCYTPRCAIERHRRAPGEQAMRRRQRMSDHAVQLREKQKARQVYGVMERQFRRYVEEARRRPGMTGQRLMQVLESRLDNVLYRAGFADSRQQSRQLVRHGHFEVNGRRTNVPSYRVRPSDVLSWKRSSKESGYYKALADDGPRRTPPTWLGVDAQAMTVEMRVPPDPAEIDVAVDTRLIVEFYSR